MYIWYILIYFGEIIKLTIFDDIKMLFFFKFEQIFLVNNVKESSYLRNKN